MLLVPLGIKRHGEKKQKNNSLLTLSFFRFRQTGRQTDGQTDRQADRQTGRQTGKKREEAARRVNLLGCDLCDQGQRGEPGAQEGVSILGHLQGGQPVLH